MKDITFKIDGVSVKTREGNTILEAALENGIYIPHLCYHPDLTPAGVCRLCMVEIEERGLAISCRTPVEEGIVVRTESPAVDKVRRMAVELLIADHHADCLTCAKNNQCELQRIAAYLGIDQERMELLKSPASPAPPDTSNPFFDRDPNKCVL
ncbi:2Fe-2S iron-sulfur cluster-binding protein, partial [Candidatus Latescibacterota bacterium]